MLIEPAVFASKAGCCLRGRRREVEPGHDPNQTRQRSFKREQPDFISPPPPNSRTERALTTAIQPTH
jgi:hypothetical protein